MKFIILALVIAVSQAQPSPPPHKGPGPHGPPGSHSGPHGSFSGPPPDCNAWNYENVPRPTGPPHGYGSYGSGSGPMGPPHGNAHGHPGSKSSYGSGSGPSWEEFDAKLPLPECARPDPMEFVDPLIVKNFIHFMHDELVQAADYIHANVCVPLNEGAFPAGAMADGMEYMHHRTMEFMSCFPELFAMINKEHIHEAIETYLFLRAYENGEDTSGCEGRQNVIECMMGELCANLDHITSDEAKEDFLAMVEDPELGAEAKEEFVNTCFPEDHEVAARNADDSTGSKSKGNGQGSRSKGTTPAPIERRGSKSKGPSKGSNSMGGNSEDSTSGSISHTGPTPPPKSTPAPQ